MKIFAGDKKVGKGILSSLEHKFVAAYVSKIPLFIETYHLTYSTILWCILILVFSYFATTNLSWLWLVSLMIFFQYLTDLFDGAVGRYRKTGLITWGYYMDHFLDYFFLCSILIGYAFLLPDFYDIFLFFILAIFGGFMVNSYLSFAATNQFRIHYLGVGPTEIRLLFILINTLIIVFGKTYMTFSLPFVLVFSFLGLFFVVFKTQKYLWNRDMKHKKKISLRKK